MLVKILIADNQEVVRAGLGSLLKGSDIRIVAEAATGDSAVKLSKKHRPDLVLLAVRLPNRDGLSTLGRIKAGLADTPVVMFTSSDNPTYIARAFALGASGYLLKSATCAQITKAI